MAKKKAQKTAAEERIVAIEEALSKGERFIEDNQNKLLIAVAAVVVVVLGFMGYQRFIVQPKEDNAKNAMFMAEKYFKQDSLDLALYGDDLNPGFLEIADDYGITTTGNLAKYYAGICFYKKGEYEEALDHLKSYDGDDVILQYMALGAIGDTYAQLGEMDEALKYYLDAAHQSESDFLSPAYLQKAGWIYEMQGNWEEALDVFNEIKTTYPRSNIAREVEKNIARAEIKLGE